MRPGSWSRPPARARRSRLREGNSPRARTKATRPARGYCFPRDRWPRRCSPMSNGSAAIPLLKAAPEPDQIADRLQGGPWRGIELCLAPQHVASDGAVAAAGDRAPPPIEGRAVTAEAPVAWPSGAFVSVDRLDDEARSGIERSADFAAGIGSPVLTIHLFAPQSPEEFRHSWHEGLDESEVERFLRFYADACGERGVVPL